MDNKQHGSKFKLIQGVYYKLTWVMFASSLILLGIGYALVENKTPASGTIIYLVTVVLYYHFAHFAYGMLSLFYFLIALRKKVKSSKIYKTIVGILVSPISFIAIYVALFLIAAASCSSNYS